jgi:hypothetical protein
MCGAGILNVVLVLMKRFGNAEGALPRWTRDEVPNGGGLLLKDLLDEVPEKKKSKSVLGVEDRGHSFFYTF